MINIKDQLKAKWN